MKKNLFFQIHKWLGIVSGLVVFIVSITGAFYTFYDDIKLKVYPERYFNHTIPDKKQPLPLTELIKNAEANLLINEKITRVDLFTATNRTWIFRAYKTNEKGFGYHSYYLLNKRVYINPYNGEVQKVENSKNEFFQIILQLHRNLLLGDTYGGIVVGVSTFIFLILLITGLILWFPKRWSWKNIKKGFILKSNSNWKRWIYDFHNVTGFYVFTIAMIFCITGLNYSFDFFKNGYTQFFNQFSNETKQGSLAKNIPSQYDDPLDNVVNYTLQNNLAADMMSIRLRGKSAKQIDIQVRNLPGKTSDFNWYYFDAKGTKLEEIKSGNNIALGDKLISLNFDLHTGNIGGVFTKWIAFFVSIICASLPITGYIMWWNKKNKINKMKKVNTKKSNKIHNTTFH